MWRPRCAAVLLACIGEPRGHAAPAPLGACNGICAQPAAHAARGAETTDDLAVAEVVNEDAGVASGRREGVVKWRRSRRDMHRRFEA
ncbi:hypothetical protein EDB83DRAFT_1465631 [Lactarius deliciosus]|nr:hypothetical protein EDB83DRAFT_1465631 [Lactarius deliciosus]